MEWWNKFYDTLSLAEITWNSGMTTEEVQEELDAVISNYEGCRIAAYITAKEDEYEVLSDAGLDNLLVIDCEGAQFLGQVVRGELYDVTEEVRTALHLDDDPGDDIPML